MTLTLAEALLFISAGILAAVAGLLIWLVIRVSKVAGEIEEGLADLRKTVGRIDSIAETVEKGGLWCSALVTGIKKGFGAMMHEHKEE